VFRSLASFEVGDGESILFWRDRWINGRSVDDIAPEVAALVPTRRKNMRKVGDALHEDVWLSDVSGDLSIEGWMQCTQLWEQIGRVPREESRPDQIIWKGSASRRYSAKETYNMLCMGRITWGMAKPIWSSFAPLKCKIFGWLAMKGRLWTSDRRARHGLQDHPDPCATCLQEEDNVDHILSHCPYARMVWFGCLRRMGSQLQEPQENTNLERWWTETRKRLRREDRRGFDTFVLLIAWTLWKQRNARVFGNLDRQLSTAQIIESVFEEFSLWEAARGGERRVMLRE
jgi:hypothetical protein